MALTMRIGINTDTASLGNKGNAFPGFLYVDGGRKRHWKALRIHQGRLKCLDEGVQGPRAPALSTPG